MGHAADLRKDVQQRWSQLKIERSSWWDHWLEISTYLLPRNGRFFIQDRNRGDKRHNKIYDSTGTRALNVLAAGLMGGLTSPAKPWFRLATSDSELNEYPPVKLWLHGCTETMQDIFRKSNTYRALHSMYKELGAFGTAASIVADDFDTIIHHHPLTIGEYAIAQDWQGRVCTLYREFQKTVGEMVKEFGRENCSVTVQNMYDRGMLDSWVTIVNAIEPRADRDSSKRDSLNMPWRSVYFEIGGNENQLLRESGYRRFPALCPRWDVAGGDVYGNSPGMEALGDIKQLQHEQMRKSAAIDYQVNPPLQGPLSLKNQEHQRFPGGFTFADMTGQNQAIRTMFDVNLNLQYLLGDIQDIRARANSVFSVDLFLMISQMPSDSKMTATEVATRNEEKMVVLGPVLERLKNELLDPLISNAFDRMLEVGIVPPPPQELQGMPLNVELVSMLAQAQRAVETNSIDRFTGSMMQLAQLKPEIMDNLDADAWVGYYSDRLGVSPELLTSEQQRDAIRQQRAQAQQQQEQQAQQMQQTQALKNLAAVPTAGGNAASSILNQFSGYGS
jgi:hypothetical protein